MLDDLEERLFGEPYSDLVAKIKGSARLSRALHTIESRYDCATLTISSLAGEAYMSIRDFQRRFRERSGLPPHQFVSRYRVWRAAHLLVESDYTIPEVARAVGFFEPRALDRNFRRFLGQSPEDLRNRSGAA
ncbi:MAG TPA: helix-turn-helix transcriptional regulator [Blastocatellia bacterium]